MTKMPKGLHWRVGFATLGIVGGSFAVALVLFSTLGLVAGAVTLTGIVLTGVLTLRALERIKADEELKRRRAEYERERDLEMVQAAREWNAREVQRRMKRVENYGSDAA